MASARERFAGTGCWPKATAGHTTRATDNDRCLMRILGPVVRTSPHTRGRRHGFPPATRMSRAGENLTSVALCNERSEEHTSELQSQSNIVCRLLIEKKKKKIQRKTDS